jgi:hypothetical protein
MDFIRPKLDGYTSNSIRKVEFGRLEAIPVLFHTGYLTIDSLKKVSVIKNGKTKKEPHYSFRRPNEEVKTSYDEYCFQTIFQRNPDDFSNLGQQLS